MDALIQDARYACRALLRARGFSLVAILTLALGIGANVTVFSIVDALVLRPLPYDRPSLLVKVWGQIAKEGLAQNWISEPEFWELRDHVRGFTAVGAYYTGAGANLTADGAQPMRVTVTRASGDVLPLLGVRPALGRLHSANEDTPGHDHVAVLDYGFWQRQLAGDPAIVGRTIQLNGEPYVVSGVLPRGFSFGEAADLWLPLALDRARPGNRGNHYLEVVARVAPEAGLARTTTELHDLAATLGKQYPQFYVKGTGFDLYERSLQADLVGDTPRTLAAVFAAVGFVLLIACINLANLLLTRGTSRRREFAVRAALGAGGARLARLVVFEGLALSAAGGLAGVLLALWGTDVVRRMTAVALPQTRPVGIDVRVLAFAAAISIVTALVFGALPALRASREDAHAALKDAARGSSSGGGQRVRRVLVVAETGLAVVLLVASGLLVRSLLRVLEVNPGFNPEHVMTARLALPQSEYPDQAAVATFYDRLEQRLRALPGTKEVGLTTLLPMTRRNSSGSTFIDRPGVSGLTVLALFQKPYFEADRRTVTPGFFDAMGIRLERGRVFGTSDTATSTPVAIVDETFARRTWPGRDPLGERIAVNAVPKSNPPVLQWRTVVGVVSHVKHNALDQLGREQVYVPLAQASFAVSNVYVVVRTDGDPSTMASAIRASVRGLDASLPVYDLVPMTDRVNGTLAARRFTMLLFVSFGALALMLAAMGTYGVIAYAVGQRTQEMGIRVALGATRFEILWMIVSEAGRLSLVGVVLGGVMALGAARALSSLLWGVTPADPATFAAAAGVLLLAGMLAALIPARRATAVDPMTAMRAD